MSEKKLSFEVQFKETIPSPPEVTLDPAKIKVVTDPDPEEVLAVTLPSLATHRGTHVQFVFSQKTRVYVAPLEQVRPGIPSEMIEEKPFLDCAKGKWCFYAPSREGCPTLALSFSWIVIESPEE